MATGKIGDKSDLTTTDRDVLKKFVNTILRVCYYFLKYKKPSFQYLFVVVVVVYCKGKENKRESMPSPT
jgi:hypothetical protein